MSLISVDPEELERAAEMLRLYLEYTEEQCDQIRHTYHSLDDMTLEKTGEEMNYAMSCMKDACNELFSAVMRLYEVIRLYRECEDSITETVSYLPYDMSSAVRYRPTGRKVINPVTAELMGGTFSGHAVNNEEWLDEMIFDRRDTGE